MSKAQRFNFIYRTYGKRSRRGSYKNKTYGKYRKSTEGKNILSTNREIMHLCQVNKIGQCIHVHSLVLVQPRKTRPFITERLLMGESNQPNKAHMYIMVLEKR